MSGSGWRVASRVAIFRCVAPVDASPFSAWPKYLTL